MQRLLSTVRSRTDSGTCLHASSDRSRRSLKCFAKSVPVKFTIKQQVNYGETLRLVGSNQVLGSWDLSRGPELQWGDGDEWSLDIDIPAGQQLSFKCVKTNGDWADWEGCNDRVVEVSESSADERLTVSFLWNDEGSLSVSSNGNGNGASAQEHGESAPQRGHHVQKEEQKQEEQPANSGSDTESGADRLAHNQWQGADVEFMQSNQHSQERRGIWDSTGLEGALKQIVVGDQKAANWLAKMELAKRMLVDEASSLPDLDTLACTYIYLQWISTGAIMCAEGGGHHRPNRHAELAREIFRSLELIIANKSADPLNQLVARRMHPKLPSFSGEYTATVPLTRIRDIAHRNDIPQNVKQEIKHTIQNKLHRNAGVPSLHYQFRSPLINTSVLHDCPEDLVATERMIERLEAEGGYNEDFMNEFRIFRKELRGFFSASTFTDILEAIKPSLDNVALTAIDRLEKAKAVVDNSANASDSDLVEALHALTTVRATLASGLAPGLRNDAPDNAIAMRQRWRLAELRAEEYAFVLLSRFLSTFAQQGGSAALAAGTDDAWTKPLGAAVLGVRHMGLSGWQPSECMALENELSAWQNKGGLPNREAALRLKASLERVQRLTQQYADGLLAIFPARAASMGTALGLSEERIQTFTEAEIRASVVFQLSELVSSLLKAARATAGSPEWDAMVAGRVSGRLMEVDAIRVGAVDASEDVILLVKSASGEEEVGAVGPQLKGVILQQSLPHLSHLGVRARQEGVVFVMCENEELINNSVRPLMGSWVTLDASAASVTLEAAEGGHEKPKAAEMVKGKKTGLKAAKPSAIKMAKKATLVALAKAVAANSGAKAAACAELERAAASADNSFSTPRGAVLPFGSMELAIESAGKKSTFDALLVEVESAEDPEACCLKLQELVASVRPDAAVLRKAATLLGADTALYVRSSANVEDLAGMSGAGLYDSLPNIPAGDAAAFGAGVAAVWASLYTRRAVLSRRAAGVKQSDAAMAVLLMEMLTPDLSFVLHTVSPLDRDENVLYAELAPGLGDVKVEAFANFSQALWASGSSESKAGTQFGPRTVDYIKQLLSVDEEARSQVGKRLAEVGKQLETAFAAAQDVEGAFVGSTMYIVQTRPQP